MEKAESREAWAKVQSCCPWVYVCVFVFWLSVVCEWSASGSGRPFLHPEKLCGSVPLDTRVDLTKRLSVITQASLKWMKWNYLCAPITWAWFGFWLINRNIVAYPHFYTSLVMVTYPRIPQGLELRSFREITNSGICLISYFSNSNQKLTQDNWKSFAL